MIYDCLLCSVEVPWPGRVAHEAGFKHERNYRTRREEARQRALHELAVETMAQSYQNLKATSERLITELAAGGGIDEWSGPLKVAIANQFLAIGMNRPFSMYWAPGLDSAAAACRRNRQRYAVQLVCAQRAAVCKFGSVANARQDDVLWFKLISKIFWELLAPFL